MRTIRLYSNKNEWPAIQFKKSVTYYKVIAIKYIEKIRELFSIVKKNTFWGFSVRLTHLSEYKITTRVIGN